MRCVLRTLILAVVVFLCASGNGQTSQTGFPPFSSTFGGVNLVNLNVHRTIPVLHKPGRGLPINFDLIQDSTIYQISRNGTNNSFVVSGSAGWNVPLTIVVGAGVTPGTCASDPNASTLSNWTYTDAQGTVHPFSSNPGGIGVLSMDPNCGAAQGSGFALDNSGYFMTAKNDGSTVVQDPSGNTISQSLEGIQSITDPNGNLISTAFSNAVTGLTITDTLGNVGALTSAFTFAQGGITLGPLTAVTYTYPIPGGSTGSVVANYKQYSALASGFGCPNVQEATTLGLTAVSLVDNIVLADGSKYVFTYEPTPTGSPVWISGAVTGRIASVTLPTGSTITYAYPGPNGGINCFDGTTMGLTVTTSDGTWTYSRAATTPATTTVTDPQGNQTVVTFKHGFEVERQMYQGSSGQGTLLQTSLTCYNGNKPGVGLGCGASDPTNHVTEVSSFLQYPNGQENERDTFFSSMGNLPVEVDEYDFGSNQPGALLRKTITTYATLGNNILNRLSSVTVCSPTGSDTACNGAGTTGGAKVAQITFGYDETTPTTTTSLSQHVTVTGSRGNLTSRHGWVNTTNNTLGITNTYDDAGRILTTADPAGNQSSFGYGCNDAFVTQTTLPTTGSTSHKTSAAYDCVTGLLTSSTDQNNQTTHFHYDGMFRTTEVDFPDGGETLTSYPDLEHVTVQRKIDSSRFTSSTTELDGYGRVSRTEVLTASSGYNHQDSCYDANGRLAFQSYPYSGGDFSTIAKVCSATAGDSFGYDALNRIRTVTHSDGSVASTSYTGRATQFNDEGNNGGGVSRISQMDALGRLANVCEVSSTVLVVGSGANPASCGLDITGTGFLTSYSYDLLDNLTTVSQGSLNARTYAYDSLSRQTSGTDPESGTTTYSYTNSSGALCSGDPSVTCSRKDARNITTTYAYDTLNRLTQVSYSDGITPTANYLYDVASGWTNPAVTQPNLIGRLSEAYTGGSSQAAEVFGYDPMGGITVNNQCSPSNCGTTNKPVSYSYDLLGDVLTSTNGESASGQLVQFNYSYDLLGRLMTMTSSLQDSHHPTSLFSQASYDAADRPLGWFTGDVTFSSGQGEGRTYDARGRLLSISTNVNTGGDPGELLGIWNFAYAPNSNVLSAQDFGIGVWTYGYDALNRLKSASNTGTIGGHAVSYTYDYDRYGNRWHQNGANNWSQAFDANNHLVGWSYDAAGNLLNDGSHSYTYDAEGRMLTVDGGSGNGGTTYTYNAFGQRVGRANSSGVHGFTHDLTGRLIADYTSTTWVRGEFYAGDRHLGTYASGSTGLTYFNSVDWVGNERMMSTEDNSSFGQCLNLPFGDGLSCSGSQPSPLHFTGLERDAESNLDHALYRQYSSAQGRWMTPDPAGPGAADPTNPQSLNLYAYAGNNPVNANDPSGLDTDYNLSGVGLFECTDSLGGGCGMSFGDFDIGNFDSPLMSHWDPNPCPGSTDPGPGQCLVGDYRNEKLCSPGQPCAYWNPDCLLGPCWDTKPTYDPLDAVFDLMRWQQQQILAESTRTMTDTDRLNIIIQVGTETKPFTQAANCVVVATFDMLPYSPGKSGLSLLGEVGEGLIDANTNDLELAAKTAGRDARGRWIANNQKIRAAAKASVKESEQAAKALSFATKVVKVGEALNDCREELQ